MAITPRTKKLLENYVRRQVRKRLTENTDLNATYVANRLSQLANELFDSDFQIRNKRTKIMNMWEEVRDILNNNDPNSLIDKVKYRGEE